MVSLKLTENVKKSILTIHVDPYYYAFGSCTAFFSFFVIFSTYLFYDKYASNV